MPSNGNVLLSILQFSVIVGAALASSDWEYGYGPKGQDNWPGVCQTGQSQSPIPLERYDVDQKELKDKLVFEGYDDDVDLTLTNDDHTTMTIKQQGSAHPKRIQVSGGDLPGDRFELDQGYFHWGHYFIGSEHMIYYNSYPMELQLLHFNKDQGNNTEEAMDNASYNTLAGLAVFFEIGETPNAKLDPLFQAMNFDPGVSHRNVTMPLRSFLPNNINTFYRYNGSLTTPGCNEIVVWTVFEEPVMISVEQMKKIWSLPNIHYVTFRSFQNLNRRKVLRYSDDPVVTTTPTTKNGTTMAWPDYDQYDIHEVKAE